jgi:glycosyltransferase involved in cell wall biosynthesis
MRSFCIVTPEYPPTRGGVADYTAQVACALAERGHPVEVWAPPAERSASSPQPGVSLRHLPDHFGPRSIAALSRALRARPERPTLFLQYVPQGFGWRGLNLPFLAALSRYSGPFWGMFHEVVYPFVDGQPFRHHVLAVGTRVMLGVVARRCDRLFVSIPWWTRYIERWGAPKRPPEWAPVPTNLPTTPTLERAAARARLGIGDERRVLCYFGMYSPAIAEPLRAALDRLLCGHPERTLLLLGRNSREFADTVTAAPGQIVATGELDAQTASNALASSDLAVFPFIDGASGRRTSLMAALALGVPVVTTWGALSEPIWKESDAVFLSPAGDAGAFADAVDEALSRPEELADKGRAGRALYEARFSLAHLVQQLASE